MKNRFVAIFFAVFFGWLGAHKFYLGRWVQGILYIIFMPICVFISFLEALQYLLSGKEWFDITFNAEYMRNRDFIQSRGKYHVE